MRSIHSLKNDQKDIFLVIEDKIDVFDWLKTKPTYLIGLEELRYLERANQNTANAHSKSHLSAHVTTFWNAYGV